MTRGNKINGTKIKELFTIGSMYADGNLEAEMDNGETWRINVNELIKMVNEFEFEIEAKKKYKYLINPTLLRGTDE